MIDWSTVFDESYPDPGATASELERFKATYGLPLNAPEIESINRNQTNPYPEHDALHASWQPFDPSPWILPNRPLPAAYVSLLSWSNGGEFRKGERWFQFFPAINPGHGVRAMLLAYNLPRYIPGALPFAMNGGGVFYLFDMRESAANGEYKIFCSPAGSLCWDPDECVHIADSFEAACRGTINVEKLLSGRTT